MNEGSITDYIELTRLMFMLNSHYRGETFRPFGETLVSRSFRENLSNGFIDFVETAPRSAGRGNREKGEGRREKGEGNERRRE